MLNVVQYLEKLGWEVSYLPVDAYGRIDPQEFPQYLKENTKIVSIMLVNNELGTIAPAAPHRRDDPAGEPGGASTRSSSMWMRSRPWDICP